MDLLKQDLSTIFEMNVIFDKFDYGKEQEVLFCDVNNTTTSFDNSNYKEVVKIFGNLEYCFPITKINNFNYLQKKFELFLSSNKIVLGNINLDKESLSLKYTNQGQFFTKYSVGFSYFIKRDFNKSRKENLTGDLNIGITIKED